MKFNLWTILGFVILLILAGAALYLYTANMAANIGITHLNEQKKTLQAELETIYKQKQLLETDVADIKKEKEALIVKINDYEAKINEITADNQAKIEDMTAQIGSLKVRLSQTEKTLPEKDAEISFLKRILKSDRDKIELLNRKISTMQTIDGKNSVSLQPITVTSGNKKVEGRVLEVNSDYGFIVVNLGTNDGIKAGDTLFVSHNKGLLGKVMVEKAASSISVAKTLYKSVTNEVQKNDLVSN